MDWQGTEPIPANSTEFHASSRTFRSYPEKFRSYPEKFRGSAYFFATPRRTECAKAPQEPLVQSFHAGQPAQHYSISAQPSAVPVADADKQTVRDFVELGLQAVRRKRRVHERLHGLRRDSEPRAIPRGQLPREAPRGTGRRLQATQPEHRAGALPLGHDRAVRHRHTAHQGGMRCLRRGVQLPSGRQTQP